MYSIDDVNQAIALLDPIMGSLQAQRGTLTPVDQQGWDGTFAGWGQLKDHWAGLTAWYQLGSTALAFAADTMGKIQNYRDQAGAYSVKVKAGGGTAPIVPNVDPGPPPPKVDPASGVAGSAASWAGTVLTVAVIGGVAYGVHAALTLFSVGRRIRGK